MNRIVACLIATGLAACDGGAKSPEDLAGLIADRASCDARNGANGFVTTTTMKLMSMTIVETRTVDVKNRRWLSLSRVHDESDQNKVILTGVLSENGTTTRDCSVILRGSDSAPCNWNDEPPTEFLTPEEQATSSYVDLGLIFAPDHGGAALASIPLPDGMPDDAFALAVTPPGGATYHVFAAADGTLLGYRFVSPKGRRPYDETFVVSYADFQGCSWPAQTAVGEDREDPVYTATVTAFRYVKDIDPALFDTSRPPQIP